MLRLVTANKNAKTTKNSFRCLIFDIQKVLDFLQDDLCFYQAQCKNTERGTRTLQNMTKQWIRLMDFLSPSACARSKIESCNPAGYPAPDPTRSMGPVKIRLVGSGTGCRKKKSVRVRIWLHTRTRTRTDNWWYQNISKILLFNYHWYRKKGFKMNWIMITWFITHRNTS